MSRKRTHEEYLALMAEKHPNITVLGTYIDSLTRVSLRCNICGHEWAPLPPKTLQGQGCRKCAGSLSLTHQEFLERIKSFDPTYDVLDEYSNSTTPVRCRCRVDGYEWKARPADLMKGKSCAKCAGILRKTHSDFVYELSCINPDVEVLGEYKNARAPLAVRCKIDGHKWMPTSSSLLRGSGCPVCAGNLKRTKDKIVKDLNALHSHIKILSDVADSSTPIRCQCLIDGHVWTTTATRLMSLKHGCPKCGKTLPWTHKDFIDAMTNVHPLLDVIGEYSTANKPIKIRCRKCGREWAQKAASILRGPGCIRCKPNISAGEQRISDYLRASNINYVCQHRFKDCVDKRTLPFDFFLPDQNIAIEFDGRQHFAPVCFGDSFEDAERNWELTRFHDQIKTDYCLQHNIKLVRIPYTEFGNIEQILDKHLA